ncbi:MAG: cupredoxin domain-containing protein [Candidatus Levybacteria bacterium]|nr:cupredoxin domain-containing protein [Candidatus Levybacteria bacterium]
MQKPIILILIAAILVIGALFFLVSKNPRKIGPGSAPIPRTEVTVGKNGFSPQSLTIKKGDTVVWINQSGEDATVNSDPHPTHNLHRFLNLGQFPSGSSAEATFNEAGTFGYHNHFNPSQKGTIVVK